MKDHEIRESVNELKDICLKYAHAECLREKLHCYVLDLIKKIEEPKNKVVINDPTRFYRQ